MSENDDYKDLLRQKHFLGEVEQAIRFANTELIHKQIPLLNKDTILAFAVQVGKLRANYLEAAFKIGLNESAKAPEGDVIDDIKRKRELFEVARQAFDALRDAIEKGYVDIDTVD
ncbi:MAG: hypothetical protein H8E36_05850 [Rhodospirillaceae bacterium]|nr:hypothetical protein [Rhodospirillaceae bacterium]MBL6941432.1 hypothetical protein [Rhodospirillales bacterium]